MNVCCMYSQMSIQFSYFKHIEEENTLKCVQSREFLYLQECQLTNLGGLFEHYMYIKH